MFPLTETAAQVGKQHASEALAIPHQLHQLINAILLEEFAGALLLEPETGIMEVQPRAFTAPGLGMPTEPAHVLHAFQ